MEIDATVTFTLLSNDRHIRFVARNRNRSSATQLPFSDTVHRDEKKHWTRFKKNLPQLYMLSSHYHPCRHDNTASRRVIICQSKKKLIAEII